ncbi:uncharacterized protein VTP21DRAFT_8600 [Calcarisporiella thermophila]|uniref:uncharacterized protein n=1 Tax=Calcarisporiella thermophila TaxID=911321 RepID=UPI0037439B85
MKNFLVEIKDMDQKEDTHPEDNQTEIPIAMGTKSKETRDYPQAQGVVNEELSIDPDAEKRLLRKLDKRILPFGTLLYLLSFLDRTNISNAKIADIEKDLNLTEGQFLWCIIIFFFGYALFEIPSNIALKRLRPSLWLSLIMLLWGIIAVCMAFSTDFKSLLSTRFLLGLFEAGLFPGLIYYLTLWYRRHEITSRLAYVFAGASLAGAFGGMIAFGITRISQPLRPWQWLFIIEGLPTIIVAFFTFLLLPDFPTNAKFLTSEERKLAVERLQRDVRFHEEKMTRVKLHWVMDVFREPRLYLFGVLCGTFTFPLYAIVYFLPSIINQMGNDTLTSQALSVAPNVVACLLTILLSMHSELRYERGLHIALIAAVGTIGFLILMLVRNNAVRYFAIFLVYAGAFPTTPIGLTWCTSNFYPAEKRNVAIAFMTTVGNAIGATGPLIYRKDDQPDYVRGHSICFAVMCLTIVLALGIKLHLYILNRARERQTAAELSDPHGQEQEKAGIYTREMTDRDLAFRFSL